MFERLKKKDGFTLVELMLVIFIIAVLSTLAVNGYTQYRRATLLDFTVDNFIAQFYSFKDRTIHGDYETSRFEQIKRAVSSKTELEEVSEGGNSMCYGYKFTVDELSGYKVETVIFDYSDKKNFDPVSKKFFYEGCVYDNVENPPEFFPIDLDSAFKFLELRDKQGNVVQDLTIVFVPPDGSIESKSGGSENFASEFVTLKVKYGESDDERFLKTIKIDLKSGNANVITL